MQVILICCAVTANLRPKSAIPTFFPFDDNHLGDIFPNQVSITCVIIIAISIAKKSLNSINVTIHSVHLPYLTVIYTMLSSENK